MVCNHGPSECISLAHSGKDPSIVSKQQRFHQGLQPHTAKICLLAAAPGTELMVKITPGYPSPNKREPGPLCHLQLFERNLLPSFGSWKLKPPQVHFSNCFFLWSQIAGGNSLTVMPLCLHAVTADL